MTFAEFIIRHPEFATAPQATVEIKLADAANSTSDSWGAQYDEVLALTAADSLARLPQGRKSRVDVQSEKVQDGNSNPYAEKLKQLKLAHGWLKNRV
jgi:hypothetical protein